MVIPPGLQGVISAGAVMALDLAAYVEACRDEAGPADAAGDALQEGSKPPTADEPRRRARPQH